VDSPSGEVNTSGATYIYIAIRRGPMRTPTTGTSVFTPTVYTGTNVSNRLVNTTIAPDMVWVRQRDSTTVAGMVVGDRLRSQPYLLTGSTAAEVNNANSFDAQLVSGTEYGKAFSSMSGFWVGSDATAQLNASTTSNNQIAEAFKRAPGFFDVVCYTGTGASATLNHNLGVSPEMVIVKGRTVVSNWETYLSLLGGTVGNGLAINTNGAKIGTPPVSSVTATTFTLNNGVSTTNGQTYVAYLFATVPGVSKVGSYTGNGSNQTINCGFTGGARFFLVKATSTTGSWWIYDSARGIISANDPALQLNSTAAEVTSADAVDPDASGLIVNQEATCSINATGVSYIFLAIA
jgi:hypothetical protein